MKRLLYLAFALLLAAVAPACGDDNLEAVSPPPEVPDQPEAENPTTPDISADPAPDAWDGVKRADVSYQLLIYSFADSDGDGTGDFQGIRSKLDYLDSLGVSAIWLSPAHPAMSYHGYDVLDYEALNENYGTEADFKQLIDDAHAHGIKIYMDWVINHTGKNHPWFRSALTDPESPYKDYYILSDNPRADIAAGLIPMIATEGANGYDAGQWFSAVTSDESVHRLKFTLSWSATPTLTVEEVETVENQGTRNSGKYLYYGDGNSEEFYTQSNNVYTLSLEFESSWGCLVRTATGDDWGSGKKYGAASSSATLQYGTPLTLKANTGSFDPADIQLPYMRSTMYHSHFWTDWFADLNYGAADQCAESPAFKTICKSAEKWIDMGIDGLRLDGAKHIYHNASSSENPTFWNTFYTTLNDYFHAKGHTENIYMVGEVFDDYAAAKPYYRGLPALFEFAFWYRLKDALNNGSGNYFAKNISDYREGYAAIRADYIAATKLTNHDESRARTDLGGSLDKAKQAAAVLLTANGSPYIYYGEELGYVGNKEGGDEYVRNPMKWGDDATTKGIAPDKLDAGMANVPDVMEQVSDSASILNVYRTFSRLRNTYPALASGKMEVHPVYNSENASYKSIAAWYMSTEEQRMLVVHNFSSLNANVPLSEDIDKTVGRLGKITATTAADGKISLQMGSRSSIVFLLK